MCGEGISSGAGLPIFLSTGVQLRDIVEKYDLPAPEELFDYKFFLENPQPFYTLAQKYLDLDLYEPTPTHHFLKMLCEKSAVGALLTKTIDNLESKVGFKPEEVFQIHGTNTGAECAVCKDKKDRRTYEELVKVGKVMYCDKMNDNKKACGEPVKPDIIFYQERKEPKFLEVDETLGDRCDLLLVIGTTA